MKRLIMTSIYIIACIMCVKEVLKILYYSYNKDLSQYFGVLKYEWMYPVFSFAIIWIYTRLSFEFLGISIKYWFKDIENKE